MRRLCLSILAAALASPAAALGDPPPTPEVGEVVVTAAGVPTSLADAPDAQVIDRARIDALQAVFIGDLLPTIPGVDFRQGGAFGGVASVSIWGASSDKTLVVIDGVPQNDPSDPNGAYDFSNLQLADVDRIEVLEGPQSSIWGSDAIGGVIAVTTRELDGWRVQAEGGSLATFDGSAGVGRRADAWAYGLMVFGDRSEGIAKADGIGPPNPYWNWGASGYGRADPASWLSLDAHARFDQSDAGVDGYNAVTGAFGYTPQYYATETWTGIVRAVARAPLGFTDTLSAGFVALDRSNTYVGQPVDSSAYGALTQDYRFTAERGSADDPWAVVLGAERQSVDASLSTGAREGLGTASTYVVMRDRPFAPLTLSASERYDATDSYGSAATGRAGAVLRLGGGFALDAAWGQGFKTPTISEIACDFCYPAGPSAGLKPERAEGWNAGAGWTSESGELSARLLAYRLSVRDQIEYGANYPFRYANVEATRSEGFQVQVGARLTRDLRLEGQYSYDDAIDIQTRAQLLRVPRDAGSASLTWAHGRWRAAALVRAEGHDADINPSTFAPQARSGFIVASVDASYAIAHGLDLTARIEDVANARYQEVLGYGEPRRMLLVGLRAHR